MKHRVIVDRPKLLSDSKLPIVQQSTRKMKNRRVSGHLLEDRSIVWEFKKLDEDGNVKVQIVRLGEEVMTKMVQIMKGFHTRGSYGFHS